MTSQFDADPTATRARAREDSSASVGQLVGQATQELSLLMRQEIALAKAELRQEAIKAGRAYGMLGGAGFAGYMVLLFLSVACWAALAVVLPSGTAALIVAVIWAVIGTVLYLAGRRQMRQVHPVPERTAETLKEIPEALKPR